MKLIAGLCKRSMFNVMLGVICSSAAFAQAEPEGPTSAEFKVMVNTLWVLATSFLVFGMNAGFASLQAQFIGMLAVAAFTFSLSLVVWFLIKQVFGLRVSPDVESQDLDITEMGMEAYAGIP